MADLTFPGEVQLAVVKESASVVAGGVGAVISSTFFPGREVEASELTKLMAGRFHEVADDMLNKGIIILREYAGCRRFAKIAKLAEKYEYDWRAQDGDDAPETPPLDLDWLLRFYDDACRVSDEAMQAIYARILGRR